jgi:hypothetical protein
LRATAASRACSNETPSPIGEEDAMKPRAATTFVCVLLVTVLGACSSAASPSTSSDSASPASSTEPSVSSASPASSSSAPASGVLGGGPLLVWQLDGLSSADAKTETVFTVDVGSGEKKTIGSIPVNEDTCCPSDVSWSSDHHTAFLFTYRFRAIVDLEAGQVTPPSGLTVAQGLTISHHGDRLAWVDMVTGTSETIVITDLAGHRIARLALPAKAWQTEVTWSPDDTTLLAITQLPLATAQIELAHAIVYCCTVDHGPTATHLLAVPVDGSPIRDLVDNAAEIEADLAAPSPTPPPGVKSFGYSPQSRSFWSTAWSPDGRSIAYVDGACPPSWDYHDRPPCGGKLTLVDVASGQRTVLTVGLTEIGSVSWSPDGQRLAFVATAGDDPSGLYVIDRAGGTPTRLTDADEWAAWSPDGTWLVFRRVTAEPVDGDRANIWIIPATGGNARHIADHAAAGW